jgi:hypothetical protein
MKKAPENAASALALMSALALRTALVLVSPLVLALMSVKFLVEKPLSYCHLMFHCLSHIRLPARPFETGCGGLFDCH